jgi:hypothetical protein
MDRLELRMDEFNRKLDAIIDYIGGQADYTRGSVSELRQRILRLEATVF